MKVKVEGKINKNLSENRTELVKFLKENTHGGVVAPSVELFNSVKLNAAKKESIEKFSWTMSTSDLDRDFEKVDEAGWILDNYKSNPIVLWSHDRNIPAIGYVENVAAGTSLSGDVVFNPKEIDEFGWSIGQRVKFGSLRSGSVSFRVIEVEFINHAEMPEEKADLIYRKQELLEFSICDIPANPFALCTEGKAKGGKKENILNDTFCIYNLLTGKGE